MTEKIKNFIESYIENVFYSFKQKENQWCNLQNFDLNTISYQDELNQEYYLLKYFPAYFTEYYHALEKFFKDYKKNSLKVISIGCGAGIDFYALKFLIESKNLDIEYDYTCIDIIDWSYKPNENNFNFNHADINDVEDSIFDDVDLIVFPKILTELDTKTIEHIISLLDISNLKDELYFLNSYITDDSHLKQINGIEQFKLICTYLTQQYTTNRATDFGLTKDEKITCSSYIYISEHQGLRSIHDFFVYPQEILYIFSNLEKKCNYVQDSTECNQCNIGTYPMMNTKYIAYLVVKFKR